MRPVFMMLMGLSLLLVTWRLTRRASGWPARTMMAGAILLAFGYAVVLPLYVLGVVVPPEFLRFVRTADPATVYGWHLTKLATMNGGWLLLGLGLALHTRTFESLFSSPQRSPR
jgi:hypothetical protein